MKVRNNKAMPIEQCQCILIEKNNLIINFTNLNRSGYFLVSTALASDQNYSQSYDCQTNADEHSKDFWCIGDCDSGNLWVEIDENENYKVKFNNTIRLDGEYDPALNHTISKEVVFEDTTNYIQGKCIPCL